MGRGQRGGAEGRWGGFGGSELPPKGHFLPKMPLFSPNHTFSPPKYHFSPEKDLNPTPERVILGRKAAFWGEKTSHLLDKGCYGWEKT